jgi:hypothetical protein
MGSDVEEKTRIVLAVLRGEVTILRARLGRPTPPCSDSRRQRHLYFSYGGFHRWIASTREEATLRSPSGTSAGETSASADVQVNWTVG